MLFRELIILEEATSTNELLFRASLQEYPLGTALLARVQTKGRGRAQRVWESAPGGMYLSVMWETQDVQGLSLLGAHCIATMCREQWGLPAQIRWPNDVVLQGKKLAGVLPQVKFVGAVVERVVLGVGWNVGQAEQSFSSEILEQATTLSHHLAEIPDVEDLARGFLERLEAELEFFGQTGCEELCKRSEGYLEGLEEGLVGWVRHESGDKRRLGRLKGLNSAAELVFEGGEVLQHLGPQERLRFES